MGQGRAGINSALQPPHELKGLSFETEEYFCMTYKPTFRQAVRLPHDTDAHAGCLPWACGAKQGGLVGHARRARRPIRGVCATRPETPCAAGVVVVFINVVVH